MSDDLFDSFLLYCSQQNIILSPEQLYTASRFIRTMETNYVVAKFMRGKVTGKSFLFKTLEDWSRK